jgi:hypothetical protein
MKLSKEMRLALKEMAKDQSDAGAGARTILAAYPDEEGDEKKEPEKDEKKETKAEEPSEKKEEAKAEGGDEKKEANAGGVRASASTGGAIDLVARIHALEIERQNEREATERKELLASRPDFSAETRTFLADLPIDQVRKAVKSFPKPVGFPAASASVQGTPGASQNSQGATGTPATKEEIDFIEAKLTGEKPVLGVNRVGTVLELGFMTPEQARKRAEEIAASAAGKVG